MKGNKSKACVLKQFLANFECVSFQNTKSCKTYFPIYQRF